MSPASMKLIQQRLVADLLQEEDAKEEIVRIFARCWIEGDANVDVIARLADDSRRDVVRAESDAVFYLQ